MLLWRTHLLLWISVMSTSFRVAKIIVLQSLWWLFVLKQQIGLWVVPIAIIAILSEYYFRKKEMSISYIVFALIASLAGFSTDLLFQYFKIVDYGASTPWFMLGIWLIFVPYYEVEFKKLRDNLLIASIVAGLSGPFAYYSVSKIDIIKLAPQALLYLGIVWAIYFPICFKLFNRI